MAAPSDLREMGTLKDENKICQGKGSSLPKNSNLAFALQLLLLFTC